MMIALLLKCLPRIWCLLISPSLLAQQAISFIVHEAQTTTTSCPCTNTKFYKGGFSHHLLRSSLSLASSKASSPIVEITPRVIAARVLIEKPLKNGKSTNNNNNPVTKLEISNDFHLLSSQRDKSFTRNLVSTTTRRKGQIDAVLSKTCDKYPPKCGKYTGIIKSCMRMGAAQVLFMDVKDFAAVKETVNVLKHEQFRTPEKLIKFVNAVLRRIVREGKDILENETSCTDNVVPWLLDEWNESYGEDVTAQMIEQILDPSGHQHVDLSLNVKPLFLNRDYIDQDTYKIEREKIEVIMSEFQSRGKDHSEIILLPNNSLRVKKGMETVVSNFPSYEEGKWWVQDVASTLPALGLISSLCNRGDDISKLHVVDMCSAPGGKTSQLLAAGFGKVTAIEASERRCKRLRENLKRLGFQNRCEVVVSPGQDWVNEDSGNEVAAVLVDVPCSATGTGNRRPDVLQKDTTGLESLHQIQEILANHCVDNILSKNGIMVYATCSLLKSESEDQVTKLIQRGGVTTLPFEPGEIPGFDKCIDENGWLRVIPGTLGDQLDYCDGFFVARLIKN